MTCLQDKLEFLPNEVLIINKLGIRLISICASHFLEYYLLCNQFLLHYYRYLKTAILYILWCKSLELSPLLKRLNGN